MRAALVLFVLSVTAFGAGSSPAQAPEDLAGYVQKHFGADFSVATKRTASTVRYLKPQSDPWTPFLTGDFDEDGIEDAAIVTRSKSPLAGRDEFGYKVIDPYFEYFGYGDPKITSTMSSDNPDEGHIVLIVQSWRAEAPKAKWAVLNLPFDNLSLTKTKLGKKKLITALKLEQREMPASLLFLDGKKWKWRDTQQ
jgi:hypothetical protein